MLKKSIHKNVIRKISQVKSLGDKFQLNEDQQQLADMAYRFAQDNLLPNANKWDAESYFPLEVLKEAGELGFGGLFVPEEYSGSALGRLDGSIIFENLSYGDISVTAFLTIHNMVNAMIAKHGNEQQKQNFCIPLSQVDKIASYCLTEPNSGSDAASMNTKAVSDGDDYIINGSKCFISGGSVSDLYLVMCLTGEKEVSAFVVPKETEGLSFGKLEKKMGWKSQPTSTVQFDNVRVPKENLIGKKGNGFKMALEALNGGRVNIGSCSLGGAQYVFDRALQYTQERKQFNKTLSSFQNVQFTLANMATKIMSSRLMIRNAAKSIDEDSHDKIILASMAKLHSTEECYKVVDQGMQLFGGYGYLHEYDIERVSRDLRVHRILEGTNEIMQLIISRNLLSQLNVQNYF